MKFRLRNLLIIVPTLTVFGSPWYHRLAFNNLVAACGEDCNGGGGRAFIVLLIFAACAATIGIGIWLKESKRREY